MIYLSNQDVAQLLTPKNCIEALEGAFTELAKGRAISRPRTDVFTPCDRPDGYHRWASMDGAIEPWGVFVTRMKSDIVTWTKQNTEEVHCVQPGTFSGFIMVFSTRNGEPLAIMNDGALHQLRVAAGAALGVKYLAREDSSSLGILGSGGMARAYLACFRAVRPIEKVRVYSPTKANREAFANEMSELHGISVEAVDRQEDAVRGMEIVAACTDSTSIVMTDPSLVEPGMHLANLSAREFGWEVVQRCDRVVQVGTETLGAQADDAKERKYYGWATWMIGTPEEIARIPKHPISNNHFLGCTSLTDLMNDPAKGRTSPEQVTFFHNLGFLGFQFAAIAAKAWMLARDKGLGINMPTEPFLQNIRD